MTPSRAAVGRVGEEARGSRAGSGVQELRRQGGEDKGQGGGRVGRGFPAPRTAVLGAGCSPDRLQQAAGGNRLCFLTAGLT